MFDGLFESPERSDILSRVDRLRKRVTPHIYQPCYDDPKQEKAILSAMPGLEKFERDRARMIVDTADDGAEVLWSRFQWPVLTREQEAHLFRRMNFHKHRVIGRIEEAHPLEVLGQVDQLERDCVPDLDGIEADASLIASCNMRLLRSTVRQSSAIHDPDHVSLAQLVLAKCIRCFNCERKVKFSTLFVTSYRREMCDEWRKSQKMTQTVVDMTTRPMTNIADKDNSQEITHTEAAADQAGQLLALLRPRYRVILRWRFGIGTAKPTTLKAIGKRLGVSKERIRQIELDGIAKLKNFANSSDSSLAIK